MYRERERQIKRAKEEFKIDNNVGRSNKIIIW